MRGKRLQGRGPALLQTPRWGRAHRTDTPPPPQSPRLLPGQIWSLGKQKLKKFNFNLAVDSLYRNQHLLAPYWPPGSGSRCRGPCTGSSGTAPSLSDPAGSFEPWDTSYNANEMPDTVIATSFNLQYVICSLTLLDILDIVYTIVFYSTSSFLQKSSDLSFITKSFILTKKPD